MTDETNSSVSEQLLELKTAMVDGATAVASKIGEAIESGRQSGDALDTLSKMTREAPLGMLLATFLIGRALAKR